MPKRDKKQHEYVEYLHKGKWLLGVVLARDPDKGIHVQACMGYHARWFKPKHIRPVRENETSLSR
jgi:hypothetical protein